MSRKLINSNDYIDICDLDEDFMSKDSIMLSQSLPKFKTKANKLSANFSYKSKYRNVLKKATNLNKKRKPSYYISNSEFDIDNIVIPHDMISNCKTVEPKNHNVPTPKWRIMKFEPIFNLNTQHDEATESLDDLAFINRHKLKELKNMIFI